MRSALHSLMGLSHEKCSARRDRHASTQSDVTLALHSLELLDHCQRICAHTDTKTNITRNSGAIEGHPRVETLIVVIDSTTRIEF